MNRTLTTLLTMLLAVLNAGGMARAAAGDTVADRVFGHPDFTTFPLTNCFTDPSPDASTICLSGGVAVDQAGTLYVGDFQWNRVLAFQDALTTDAVADRVFGQPDFTSITSGGGPGGLTYPFGVALDNCGNLYVADLNAGSPRVAIYRDPLTTDNLVDLEIHPSDGLFGAYPLDVAVDRAGNLYVSDLNNNRVLEYDRPLLTDTVADRVFGQPDFATTSTAQETCMWAMATTGS